MVLWCGDDMVRVAQRRMGCEHARAPCLPLTTPQVAAFSELTQYAGSEAEPYIDGKSAVDGQLDSAQRRVEPRTRMCGSKGGSAGVMRGLPFAHTQAHAHVCARACIPYAQ